MEWWSECDGLRDAQACGIAGSQDGAMFPSPDAAQKLNDFLRAENNGQFFRHLGSRDVVRHETAADFLNDGRKDKARERLLKIVSEYPDTAAANGPTQGALVLWLVDQGITENRPLILGKKPKATKSAPAAKPM